jgi:hypothetical protein
MISIYKRLKFKTLKLYLRTQHNFVCSSAHARAHTHTHVWSSSTAVWYTQMRAPGRLSHWVRVIHLLLTLTASYCQFSPHILWTLGNTIPVVVYVSWTCVRVLDLCCKPVLRYQTDSPHSSSSTIFIADIYSRAATLRSVNQRCLPSLPRWKMPLRTITISTYEKLCHSTVVIQETQTHEARNELRSLNLNVVYE